MENKTSRRSFLKVSSISGGGMLLGFSWLASLKPTEVMGAATGAKDWVELTGFIKIMADNQIKILSPNPEFGQNVMTSLPMLIAEELEVDWKKITIEMGDYDTPRFKSQFTGGSQSIRSAWGPLRKAGATAKYMLLQAAANQWNVPLAELNASNGTVIHKASNRTITYGQLADAAAKLPVPTNLVLKKSTEHSLVGKSQKNVEGTKIVAGKSLFTMDYQVDGMLIAMAIRPPAFGMQLKSYNATEAKKMPGIKDVFDIEVYKKEYERAGFDTRTFNHLIVVVGNSTWEVINARKKVVAQWEPIVETKEMVNNFGRKKEETIPAGLESSDKHMQKMLELQSQKAKVLRKDGDPETAFASAKKIIEKTYSAPFLPHNTMEPISCFAHITDEKAFFVAPIQIPDMMKQNIVANLDVPADKIEMKLARMGGGFGRRAYGHYIIEAGLISKKMKAPVKFVYTREDDMTYGIYRPMYTATYRAALDANKNLIAFHVKGGGIPEHPVHANRFPAGAVENYLAEGWQISSNITIGAFRAPRSNFNAAAEQSFLDELAEAMGKDPIDFRLELLKKAKETPVGKNNDYNAERYAAVLQLVKEKSGWGKPENKKYSRGVAAYFCHNSYAAHVVDMVMKDGQPYVERVFSAIDCGIVINPDAATNMVQGAVVDGIGNAFYGGLTHIDGAVQQTNFQSVPNDPHERSP